LLFERDTLRRIKKEFKEKEELNVKITSVLSTRKLNHESNHRLNEQGNV